MQIYFLYFFSLLIAFSAHAEFKEDRASFSLGTFREDEGDHAGVEVSSLVSGNYAAFRFSGVLLSDESSAKIKEIYGGFAASGYMHLNQKYVNPYMGFGLFLGETFKCSEQEEEDELCKEDQMLAAFPELGVAINIGKFHIFPFARRYFDTNQSSGATTTYGLHIGFTSD